MRYTHFVKFVTSESYRTKRNRKDEATLKQLWIDEMNRVLKASYTTFQEVNKAVEAEFSRIRYENNRDEMLEYANRSNVKRRLKKKFNHISDEDLEKEVDSELRRINMERKAKEKQQKDAIYDMTYNCNNPNFRMSTFVAAVNKKKKEEEDMIVSAVNVNKPVAKLVEVTDGNGNSVKGSNIISATLPQGGASVVPNNEMRNCGVRLAPPNEQPKSNSAYLPPVSKELKLVPHQDLILKWLQLNMEPVIFTPGNILSLPDFIDKFKAMIVKQWRIDPSKYGVNRLVGDLYYKYLDICSKKNGTK